MGTIKDTQSLYSCLLILLFFAFNTNCQRVVPGVNPQHYQQVPVQQQQQYQQQHPPQAQQYQQQEHMAPGMNPQHYQQPQQQPHQQQQYQQQQQNVPVHPQQVQQQQVAQQQQQQHQQVPQQQQQHQQVPQQQQQHQQVPQQQQPHGQHAPHGQQQQVLHAGNMDQERAHIQEHMQVPIDTSKMSEAELQFHYFKMHDSDNNNKLDGCELIKSLIHWHEQGSKEQHNSNNEHKPHIEEKVFSDEELTALIDPILQMDDTSKDGFIDYPEFIKAQQKAAAKQQQDQQQQQQQQQG